MAILCYNASIWLTPDLNSSLKHDLLSLSANALRMCMPCNSLGVSFENLQVINKKCTPNQIMLYQLAISLSRIFNFDESPNFEAITVIDQAIFTSRQINFQILRNNRRKIGLYCE